LTCSATSAAEIQIDGKTFTLSDGFELQHVAGPPLVNRPISADFDEAGYLYVTDSSGSNDPVQVQLKEKPHRVVRLEDTDGDGRFDKSVVFADGLMFPEGALWYDGSLYVAAPPQIWKLTDTDGDGKSDKREVWFDGKTLNGCANDLHGPYLGPDGWIYWCKGAFQKQTYERKDKPPFVTRASHIFRRRPSGGEIEHVMTGGMDNPVEVAFTPGGERIFTTTFLVHPRDGRRDGLIHAVYGGVYGKDHGVLDGHARTGPLMPVLSHLGAAAPSGLMRLKSSQFGAEYKDNLFASLFNMRTITRHVLTPKGATFESRHSDLLVCENVDFHPTDVLEDADGSLIVVDTGGWYKLCCPTSQLHKPDILGAIYRVRRKGAHKVTDPRGLKLDWPAMKTAQLASLLGDSRPAVRKRAVQQLAKQGAQAVGVLKKQLAPSIPKLARRSAVWALTRIPGDQARAAVRLALDDLDETVRQAALHSVSLWKDDDAHAALIGHLSGQSRHNRRAAAEALGRIGDRKSVAALLRSAATSNDRCLDHALTFATMEIGDAEIVRPALQSREVGSWRAALIALDQMPGGNLSHEDVVPLLNSKHAKLRETAWWIAGHHPKFAPHLADVFRQQIKNSKLQPEFSSRLAKYTDNAAVQSVIADALAGDVPTKTKLAILEAVAASSLQRIPSGWAPALRGLLASDAKQIAEQTVAAIRVVGKADLDTSLVAQLRSLAGDKEHSTNLRISALAAIHMARKGSDMDPKALHLACECLAIEHPVRTRSRAVDVLLAAKLNDVELEVLAEALPGTGPIELKRLLPKFTGNKNQALGTVVAKSLIANPAARSLAVTELEKSFASFGGSAQAAIKPLLAEIKKQNSEKLQQIDSILPLVEKADVRRGHQVFFSSQAACAACHQLGYVGGRVGPDLNRIGRIRTERDLLESILFPSASFVRSYEPVEIITIDGKIYNGIVRDETETEVVLALDAEKQVRILHDEIDERTAGKVSIMPKGLDKQLTAQQLADLVAFLKAAR
jgi:putative membrane-bound dehydrogenase-like protein